MTPEQFMTDAERLNLLRQIIAQPKENTPRLLYADWLQDHQFIEYPCRACSGKGCSKAARTHDPKNRCDGSGRLIDSFDPLAQFIRIQIAIADLLNDYPHNPYCRRCGWLYDACECKDTQGNKTWNHHPEVIRRLRELKPIEKRLWEERNWSYLSQPIAEQFHCCIDQTLTIETRNRVVLVRRGWIEELECTADMWELYGPMIASSQPLQEVVLRTMPPANRGGHIFHVAGMLAAQWKWTKIDRWNHLIFWVGWQRATGGSPYEGNDDIPDRDPDWSRRQMERARTKGLPVPPSAIIHGTTDS